jgi:hypothetical protein
MPDGHVIAEEAFYLDPQGNGQVDMDRRAEEWRAYDRQPKHLRMSLYGYRMRLGVTGGKMPAAVTVAVHKRTVRAEHRSYRVGVVIVREV